jgi:hypothetical protein
VCHGKYIGEQVFLGILLFMHLMQSSFCVILLIYCGILHNKNVATDNKYAYLCMNSGNF